MCENLDEGLMLLRPLRIKGLYTKKLYIAYTVVAPYFIVGLTSTHINIIGTLSVGIQEFS